MLSIFALGNAGLRLGEIDLVNALTNPASLGIMLGLFAGKPVGIFIFSYLSVKLKIR